MATVLLYGHLAEKYGKRHEYQISSPGEALRALRGNYPGFEKEYLAHQGGYHILVGYENVNAKTLDGPVGQREVIRIVPAVAGAGYAAIAAWIAQATGWGAVASGIAAAVVVVAINMAVAGIASALFAPDKPDIAAGERPENKPSYAFNGPVNTIAQGHPVPVGYGQVRVGSQVISAGLSSEQIPV